MENLAVIAVLLSLIGLIMSVLLGIYFYRENRAMNTQHKAGELVLLAHERALLALNRLITLREETRKIVASSSNQSVEDAFNRGSSLVNQALEAIPRNLKWFLPEDQLSAEEEIASLNSEVVEPLEEAEGIFNSLLALIPTSN